MTDTIPTTSNLQLKSSADQFAATSFPVPDPHLKCLAPWAPVQICRNVPSCILPPYVAGNRGLFIVLEGLDCTGKTTLVPMLLHGLRQSKLPFYTQYNITLNDPRSGQSVHNPGYDHLAELRAKNPISWTIGDAENCLFAYLQNEMHLYAYIRDKLPTHNIIMDRSFLSTLIYQVEHVPGISAATYCRMLGLLGGRMPDLFIILDVPSDVALKRFESRRIPNDQVPLPIIHSIYRTHYAWLGGRKYEGDYGLTFLEVYGDPSVRWRPVLYLDATKPVEQLVETVLDFLKVLNEICPLLIQGRCKNNESKGTGES